MSEADLTPAERLRNAETMRHILTVRALMLEAIGELARRAAAHDLSKLRPPEVGPVTEHTPKLEGLCYDSPEYQAALEPLRAAIEHHKSNNSHHPEYYPDGVSGMDLFDLLEMLCDWKAATLRHADGNLDRSLALHAERYAIPGPLVRVLANTLPSIERLASAANVAASYPHVGEARSGRSPR